MRHLSLFLLALMVLGCSRSGGFDSAPGLQPGTEETTPPPTAHENPKIVDPWLAPVGAEISGVTLKDGWYDLRELTVPVNVNGGWTDSAAIARSGKSLYFSYTSYSFSDLVESSQWTITGPLREGMTGNHFKNFKASLTENGWHVDYLTFNSSPDIHESSISLNTDENLAVFSRWESTGSVARLYFSQKDGSGKWSQALELPTNVFGSQCSNDNPFIVGDLKSGVDLYFESDRTDLSCSAGGGKKHIYHVYYNPSLDQYSAITKVKGINGEEAEDDDTQFYISADKTQAFWTAVRPTKNQYGIFTADLINGVFQNVRPVVLPTTSSPFSGKLVFPGEANIVELPQGYLMYMMCGMATKETGITHGVRLKICRAKKDKFSSESKKINTSQGWSDSPFISRDGQRLYFTYSRWNFAPWILDNSKMPVLSGPDRPGLRHNTINPFDESDIYVATKKSDGAWGEPVNLGLNDDWGDASGMEINDGAMFIWLRGNGSQNQIVSSKKNIDGSWSKPTVLGGGINQLGVIQDNPHLSSDGNAIWFTSDRGGGAGGKDIWFSTFSGTEWGQPVNASKFNSSGFEDQFYLAPNSKDIFWTGPLGTMHCVSDGSGCSSAAELIVIPGCSYVAEISMPDDMQTIYFGCGNPTTGRIQIMFSEKQNNGSWGPAKPVD